MLHWIWWMPCCNTSHCGPFLQQGSLCNGVLTVRPPHLVNENHVCRMPFSLDMFRVPKVQPAPRGNLRHSDALRRYSRPRHEWRCQIKENKAVPPTDRMVVVSTFVTALSDRSASLVSEDLSFFTSTVTQGILRWPRLRFAPIWQKSRQNQRNCETKFICSEPSETVALQPRRLWCTLWWLQSSQHIQNLWLGYCNPWNLCFGCPEAAIVRHSLTGLRCLSRLSRPRRLGLVQSKAFNVLRMQLTQAARALQIMWWTSHGCFKVQEKVKIKINKHYHVMNPWCKPLLILFAICLPFNLRHDYSHVRPCWLWEIPLAKLQNHQCLFECHSNCNSDGAGSTVAWFCLWPQTICTLRKTRRSGRFAVSTHSTPISSLSVWDASIISRYLQSQSGQLSVTWQMADCLEQLRP